MAFTFESAGNIPDFHYSAGNIEAALAIFLKSSCIIM
jgi:hypothetical protein